MTAPIVDILKPILDEDLPNFINITKNHFPKSIRAHHYLLQHYKWKKTHTDLMIDRELSVRCRCHFYTHRYGDMKNCTFIAIGEDDNIKSEPMYGLFMFTLEEDNNELMECLKSTNRIKWEYDPLIVSIQMDNYDALYEVIELNNFDIHWTNRYYCMWLPKEKAREFSISDLSNDVILAPLQPSDSDQINLAWPYHSQGSSIYIKSQIVLNGGFGIYEKETNRLLSWVILSDNYGPGSLQTIESEKRKGYGEVVLKMLCRKIAAEDNLDIFLMVLIGNQKSLSLFQKLGFEVFDECAWEKIDSKMMK